MYSSYVQFLSFIVPSSLISMIRFGHGLDELMVMDANNMIPLKSIRPLLTAVMDSRSRWLVGCQGSARLSRTASSAEACSAPSPLRKALLQALEHIVAGEKHSSKEAAHKGLRGFFGNLAQPFQQIEVAVVEEYRIIHREIKKRDVLIPHLKEPASGSSLLSGS
jgi:hypothetical protein